jgi:predicted metal-dependent enzyme (double-stranded beta helix superfamily)
VFDTKQFIAECREASAGRAALPAVREIVARAVSEPAEVIHALGEPTRAGAQVLYRAADLTVFNLIWGPRMIQLPHDHAMWAVIGIYTGREDNVFWRRLPTDAARGIETAGAKALGERDAVPLGPDIIHSVVNPIRRLTGAIHVYGGDFFDAPRSEWDPETLVERPYDVDKTLALFEESNRLYPPT